MSTSCIYTVTKTSFIIELYSFISNNNNNNNYYYYTVSLNRKIRYKYNQDFPRSMGSYSIIITSKQNTTDSFSGLPKNIWVLKISDLVKTQ